MEEKSIHKMSYGEKVFRELRIYTANKAKKEKETYPAAAVTLNENLKAYGFVMDPETIKKVIANMNPEGMKKMQDDVAEYAGKVKAAPMYPGFPQEVLDMDEAQYRMDQLCHYFSTYGIRLLTGREVKKGWLPEEGKEEGKEFNGFSADLKKIDVVFGDDGWILPMKIILSRRSRLAPVEEDIITEAVSHADEKALSELSVPFKENIVPVFEIALKTRSVALAHASCQHTGDVIKCLSKALRDRHYKMTTSEKKFAARVIESYSADNFRSNLCLSAKKAKEADDVMKGISYSKFSRSMSHSRALHDLRAGELKSWNAEVESCLAVRSPEAISKLAERPGMLLRSVNRLLKLGYDREAVTGALAEKAAALSTATIISVMEKTDLSSCLMPALEARLAAAETPLKGKKVFFDEQSYDTAHSCIAKSEEGGYVRSGMAFRIPETARRIRFFVYWNDEKCVDIDLHAYIADVHGANYHIGWNDEFRGKGAVMSGDITHSDAAEYIDVDLANADISKVFLSINLYSGRGVLGEVQETLAGIMGISKLGQNIAHYDPKSCFISERLTSNARNIFYGVIDIQNRFLRIEKKENTALYSVDEALKKEPSLTLAEYIDALFRAQNVEKVASPEEADVVLSVAKGGDFSLLDENFFMDC